MEEGVLQEDIEVIQYKAAWLESNGYESFYQELRDRDGPCRLFWETDDGEFAIPDLMADGPDDLFEISAEVLTALLRDFTVRPTTIDDWPLLAEASCSFLGLTYRCVNVSINDVVERAENTSWLMQHLLEAFPGATHASLHMALLAALLQLDTVTDEEVIAAGNKLLEFCDDTCIQYAHSTGFPLLTIQDHVNKLIR